MAVQVLSRIRYSARTFLRTPGLTLALLLTIALGIGSNVCIHGFVRGLTRTNSALTSVARIVSVFGQDAHHDAGPLSYQEYLSLKSRGDILPADIASAGQSAIVSIAAVTPDLAGLFHLPVDSGAVISDRMWQSEFGAKADIHGEQIRIDGVATRVGGVAPKCLEGVYRDRTVDVWLPLREEALQPIERSSPNLWVLARLRRDVSIAQARTAVRSGEMDMLPYTGMTPELAAGMSRVGTLLNLAAGAVFFIACANVASFLLGRAFARSHEISVRVALGANRAQLARDLLSDSVVISIAGGACGMLLALWTSRVVPALLFEQDAESLIFAPDPLNIVAWSGACAGITIVCGLLPILVVRDDRPATVLRREGAGPSLAIRRLRVGLVVAQMTSCCVLVISTAFLLDGLRTALQTSAGHRLGNPILATVQARPDVSVDVGYFQHVEQAARSLPGASVTAWAGRLPGSQPTWQSFRIDPSLLPLREVTLDIGSFTPASLELFKLPPIAGRMFGFAERSCRAAIVNEEAAEQLFGASTAGRTLQDSAGLPIEITGVVAMRKRRQTIPRSTTTTRPAK
jgi:hypothetical protein